MTVTLKPRTETAVPKSILRKAGYRAGDQIEFKVAGRTIMIVPKLPSADREYTAAERRAINRGIEQSEKEYQAGLGAGPFETHEEFIAALHTGAAKPRRRKANRRR
jgi:bifunctional DNA-binding transcriptional regulator/antitoxin component of YhaV-PrlF toxin-antitoxin module